ncbi:transketolase family protein [Candidatus Woesebacteria bacterium]|nr:transketolase family protein [Candidatus Woesebacteria bacterium]MCD8507514.1 transketolase family protein [Candidatus Woesebacteria bacterium]MCD8527327.1 transketolase family protein [Candidatus Woesebacteria bacterium]MCD8545745.1 transketolase family protein [Candidatus Woesebacteria bacterium]
MIKYHISRSDFVSAPLSSIRDGFGEALVELGRKHWNVVTVMADLGGSLRMQAFAEQFPERAFEVGVAEQNMIGMAAGMAKEGLIPFAGSFAAFSPGRTFDQIRVSVCYSNNPVKVVGGHAGVTVGPDGATHQMCEDLAMMRALPNIEIVVPSDGPSAIALTEATALREYPAYIRLSRAKSKALLSAKAVKFGEVTQLKPGQDVTLITMGVLVDRTMQLAFDLEDEGISAEVLLVSTLKPLEEKALIAAAKRTGRVVTLEEHQKYNGLGSAVAEVLSQHAPTPMEIIGIEDTFGESGQSEELLDAYGFERSHLLKRVLQFAARTQ